MNTENYSVFVNDQRINNGPLTETEAADLSLKYVTAGFDDVVIVDENTAENIEL